VYPILDRDILYPSQLELVILQSKGLASSAPRRLGAHPTLATAILAPNALRRAAAGSGLRNNPQRPPMRVATGPPLSSASHHWGWGLAVVQGGVGWFGWQIWRLLGRPRVCRAPGCNRLGWAAGSVVPRDGIQAAAYRPRARWDPAVAQRPRA
jgi:hypothetical protein